MKLTGKAEKDFEKWYINNYDLYIPTVNGRFTDKEKYPNFKFNYPQSMQFGVYLYFFASKNKHDAENILDNDRDIYIETGDLELSQSESIKTQNEIYNLR